MGSGADLTDEESINRAYFKLKDEIVRGNIVTVTKVRSITMHFNIIRMKIMHDLSLIFTRGYAVI